MARSLDLHCGRRDAGARCSSQEPWCVCFCPRSCLASQRCSWAERFPAAARAVATDDDLGRRRIGWLYGVNTLGAVAGCLAATFWLFEAIGTRRTLLAAVAVNIVVSLGAFFMARGAEREAKEDAPREDEPKERSQHAEALTVRRFVVAAAGIVGFCFFVMEIVWYRMLGPLLGGTVFTFGLILAVALFGIGLGGAAYGALRKDREPTLESFSATALLEASFVIIPYALGDRIATFALGLRSLGMLGFAGHVVAWVLVTVLVVLPVACVAGLQFPMLIALLGRGRSAVGRETGLAYAANTAGAIAGSLLGGFVLLPWLGAPGCWRAVAALLAALGLAAALLASPARTNWARLILPVGLASIVAALLTAHGPTAVWRHSPIGVGRVPADAMASRNAWHDWTNAERRSIRWETDGIESSVALSQRVGFSFVINGKVDGHIRGDAPTQVMSGILGAIFHPHPRSALVIGLGTGESAGWLGAIPEMRQVDVVELEPAIQRVARDCAVANHGVLDNPKVRLVFGDGAKSCSPRAPSTIWCSRSPRIHTQRGSPACLRASTTRRSPSDSRRRASSCNGCRPTKWTPERFARSTRRWPRYFRRSPPGSSARKICFSSHRASRPSSTLQPCGPKSQRSLTSPRSPKRGGPPISKVCSVIFWRAPRWHARWPIKSHR